MAKEDGGKVTERTKRDDGEHAAAAGEGFRGGTRSQAVYINLAPTIHIQVGIHTLSEAARLVE